MEEKDLITLADAPHAVARFNDGYVDAVLGDYRVRPGSASANGGQLRLGNIKTYEKARAALALNRPEIALIDRMIAENRAILAFEHAIDRVIDGDTARGLRELRALDEQVSGSVWAIAFQAWKLFPELARPMLSWRRKAHSRGGQDGGLLQSLFGSEA